MGKNSDLADLARLVADPVAFARGILGTDPWETPAAILRSVAAHPRTAVRSCHASGKSHTAAVAAVWWTIANPEGIVLTLAPTQRQVTKVLWGEIHAALARSRIALPEPLQAEWRLGPNNYALGLSPERGVNLQGYHGKVLIILDEAPGIEADILEAIEGIAAGGDVRLLALGNPTEPGGWFFDAFTSKRDGWNTFAISAFDTPNLAGLTPATLLALSEDELDQNERPYLVTRRWVCDRLREWGEDSPQWQSRVLGQFPQGGTGALFSLAALESARRQAFDGGGPVAAGIDVAGPGEAETVVCIRERVNILALHAWADREPRGAVLAALRPWWHRLEAVNVDTAGIGYYFAQHLRDEGVPVEEVNVGTVADDPERFANRKAELYWSLRELLEGGALRGLRDETAVAQLAALRYRHDARGRVVIEAKEAARRRGVPSPDRAEAIVLAFADRASSEPLRIDPRILGRILGVPRKPRPSRFGG